MAENIRDLINSRGLEGAVIALDERLTALETPKEPEPIVEEDPLTPPAEEEV